MHLVDKWAILFLINVYIHILFLCVYMIEKPHEIKQISGKIRACNEPLLVMILGRHFVLLVRGITKPNSTPSWPDKHPTPLCKFWSLYGAVNWKESLWSQIINIENGSWPNKDHFRWCGSGGSSWLVLAE